MAHVVKYVDIHIDEIPDPAKRKDWLSRHGYKFNKVEDHGSYVRYIQTKAATLTGKVDEAATEKGVDLIVVERKPAPRKPRAAAPKAAAPKAAPPKKAPTKLLIRPKLSEKEKLKEAVEKKYQALSKGKRAERLSTTRKKEEAKKKEYNRKMGEKYEANVRAVAAAKEELYAKEREEAKYYAEQMKKADKSGDNDFVLIQPREGDMSDKAQKLRLINKKKILTALRSGMITKPAFYREVIGDLKKVAKDKGLPLKARGTGWDKEDLRKVGDVWEDILAEEIKMLDRAAAPPMDDKLAAELARFNARK